MRGAGIIGILLFTVSFCFSQEVKRDTVSGSGNLADTTIIENRPVEKMESYALRYDPRKAMLFAAVLPGMGQAYNKKYWKMPLVYGGFGALIYGTSLYQGLYLRFKTDLFTLINDPTSNGGFSPDNLTKDQLRSVVDRTRRERDFFIILTGFFYLLQMVDAHVDAHLKEFDLNPKLQLTVEPTLENNLMIGRSTGLTLTIKF